MRGCIKLHRTIVVGLPSKNYTDYFIPFILNCVIYTKLPVVLKKTVNFMFALKKNLPLMFIHFLNSKSMPRKVGSNGTFKCREIDGFRIFFVIRPSRIFFLTLDSDF